MQPVNSWRVNGPSIMDDDFRKSALDYHRLPRPGKLSVEATKRMANQRDLALAYSPGGAAPCEAIAADPSLAREYTARGNLVAVITNGTAVLGLGNIGPLASKPGSDAMSARNCAGLLCPSCTSMRSKIVSSAPRVSKNFGGSSRRWP